MYEQISHSLLNDILKELRPELHNHNLHYFYIRLGANFYAIYSLFYRLYGEREDFKLQLTRLVKIMAMQYIERHDELREEDRAREKDYNWFLHQKWTGMALYTNGFAGNLQGLIQRIPYFEELGINLVHIMPILKCPEDNSDGGYAVSDFRRIDERAGTMEDLDTLSRELESRNILLVLDVVVNHISNEHEWAARARQGKKQYQDYFYMYDDREIPDRFEQFMPEIFPTSSPGNFSWDETLQKWVMTVFHDYQWDLNYSNPDVFIEMIDIILFWANTGADIIRLDAVAFLWKKIGTTCQNEREAHLLLQLMKDCCQVTAPGVLFIAEAIVAPLEIGKYFGEDAIIAKECEIAYNATFMALLWDAIATKNSKLLYQGISNLPVKLERATWLNYVRCHDDIGLGFADSDIIQAGYEPFSHREFLINYYTGEYASSLARGLPFARNAKTGDARISGSLASLAGLETALEEKDPDEIELAINRILLLHSLILSFGGIPLIYYGDELGCTNDYSTLNHPFTGHDTRWIHRPKIDWEQAEARHRQGTVQFMIFNQLKKMIAVRKEIPAFADFNNRELVDSGNEHLFVFIRFHPQYSSDRVLVIANFDDSPQTLAMHVLDQQGFAVHGPMIDLVTGASPVIAENELVIPGSQYCWLTES
jgi:amylosucrase